MSPPFNPNKRQRVDWDWDFLTSPDHSFSPRMSISPSPERSDAHAEHETDDHSISLQSTHHSTQKSGITSDKTAISQPKPRLTRNQAHQQGIIFLPIFFYFAYTNTLPLFSLLLAALPLDPIEPQTTKKLLALTIQTELNELKQ